MCYRELEKGVSLRFRYKNPPILEAYVEFVFDEQQPDTAVGGRFYEGWKARCGLREQILVQQLQVQVGLAPPLPSPPPLPTERLWLVDAPGIVVQVGPSFLSVHFVRPDAHKNTPYPGFESLLPHVHNAIKHYVTLVTPTRIRQLSMRYINQFAVPLDEGNRALPWLTVGAHLPTSIDSELDSLAVEARRGLTTLNSGLRYVFRASAREGFLDVRIDTTVISDTEASPVLDEISLDAWLRAAHDEGIIRAFEGSITDLAREEFGAVQ